MRRLFVLAALLVISAAAAHADPPSIGGCQIFPADNPWNADISGAAVHPNSKNYIKNINAHGGDFVHPDFGGDTNDWYGIPWDTTTSATSPVDINFEYDDESDPGPYPIPDDARIEGGGEQDGDRHVLIVETTNCILYEMYASYPNEVGGDITSWDAGSGAVYDLDSNAVRPEGWTSADAAGLPILPGLARCDEANTVINHALRFTVGSTQSAFVYPATHEASGNTNTNFPPMGLRLRLKASFNESGFTGQSLAIVKALKKYGMILADNGSNWFISGEYNPACWDDETLEQLKDIRGTSFEAIVSPPPPVETEGDLVRNGSFEAGAPGGKKPTFWTLSVHKDTRACDHDGIDFANTGRCAFEFKGTGAHPVDYISQTVKMPALAPGDSVSIMLNAATDAGLVGASKMKVSAVYGSNVVPIVTVDLGSGTNAYSLISTGISGSSIPGMTKVKLKISYKGKTGKLYVDSVSVVANTVPRALPLPLPLPPS